MEYTYFHSSILLHETKLQAESQQNLLGNTNQEHNVMQYMHQKHLDCLTDKQYLAAHGIDADEIAGLIPFSGNVINHLTIRAEQGIPITQPTIDAMAPLYHVRPDAPPILLITGDREKELVGRYEENAYFWRMMQVVGHPDTRIFELDGYGHGMVEPATPLLLEMVKTYSISILTDSKK